MNLPTGSSLSLVFRKRDGARPENREFYSSVPSHLISQLILFACSFVRIFYDLRTQVNRFDSSSVGTDSVGCLILTVKIEAIPLFLACVIYSAYWNASISKIECWILWEVSRQILPRHIIDTLNRCLKRPSMKSSTSISYQTRTYIPLP